MLWQLEVETRGQGLLDITQDLAQALRGQGDGLLTVFIRHSSASLLIQENADPDVKTDLMTWLSRLVPPSDDPAMAWVTHRLEGPDDMPAHIKAAHLPVSLQIPVADGQMMLGTWQGVFVVEHRSRPHHRRVALHFAPD